MGQPDAGNRQQIAALAAEFKAVAAGERENEAETFAGRLRALVPDATTARLKWLADFEPLIPLDAATTWTDRARMVEQAGVSSDSNDPRFDSGPGKQGKRRPVRFLR
jgi:hypothetical protein